MSSRGIVSVSANCLILLGGNRAFLLTELEVAAPGVDIGPVLITRLTSEQARRLEAAGEPVCQVTANVPQPGPGFSVEFKCVFIEGEDAFLIYNVENATDTEVLVAIDRDEAEQLVNSGVRACTVIERPFL